MVYLPLNSANSDDDHYITSCTLGNLKTKVFASDFTELLTTIRRHVIHKNHNYCLSTFAVTALGILLIVISVTYLCLFCHLKTCLAL